jgi:class 3 adenylate cyclase
VSAARIVVHLPDREPQPVDIDGILDVGRAADGLVLADERCSRRHCRFEAAPSGLVVEDLGSTNGTWVNGAAIVGPARVRAGDVVVVGSTRIVVAVDGAPAPLAPPGGRELDATVIRLRESIVGGMVTIAFTDIVDSTAIGASLGDAEWFALLERHDRLTRALLDTHGGTVVKHQGDGFMLSFPSAHQAVCSGLELQRELAALRARDTAFPLHVRMGVHTGDVLRVDGDLFGRHVNLAARVAGVAGADEVLVSEPVYEMVSAAGDVEFGAPRDVGLKGFTERFALRPAVGSSAASPTR